MTVTATTTKFVQVFGTVLQVLNAVNVAGLPLKWQAAFTGALSALQAIEGIMAHYSTPDGQSLTSPPAQSPPAH